MWTKNLKKAAKTEEIKTRNITAWRIKKVNPKTVVVEIGDKNGRARAELTLPLNPDIYTLLTSIASFLNQQKDLPYVMTIDEKNYVIDILPKRVWLERQEKKENSGEQVM
jgi:hypothetical protein